MKRLIIWTSIILTSCVIGGMYFMGFFTQLEVIEQYEGGYLLGGFYHKGPYEQIGLTVEKVKKTADSLGFPTDTIIGCYFDDPNEIAPDSLQSFVGAILASGDFTLIGNIEPGNLDVHPIFNGSALTVDFPNTNSWSPMIGALRVYPYLTQEAEKRGFETGQVYEIYTSNSIRYVFQTFPVAQEASESFWNLIENPEVDSTNEME